MSNIYVGNIQGGKEGGPSVSFDQSKGYSTTRNFKGTQAFITSKELELIQQGYSTKVTAGAVWDLEASIAGDARDGNPPQSSQADTVDTWELFGGRIEKDLLNCNVSPFTHIAKEDMAFLRDIADGKIDHTLWDESTTAKTRTWITSGTYLIDTKQVFYAIRSGVKSRIYYQPTLRHTQSIPENGTFQNYVSNAGKVYSSAVLSRTYGVPAKLSAVFLTSAQTTRTDGLILYTGWMQEHPTVNIQAGSRTQVTQEWTWGDWAMSVVGEGMFVTT